MKHQTFDKSQIKGKDLELVLQFINPLKQINLNPIIIGSENKDYKQLYILTQIPENKLYSAPVVDISHIKHFKNRYSRNITIETQPSLNKLCDSSSLERIITFRNSDQNKSQTQINLLFELI